MRDGVLEHVHPVFGSRAVVLTKGGARTQCQGADRLYKRVPAELAGVRETGDQLCRLPHDVSRYRRTDGAVRSRRSAPCAKSGRTDCSAHDPNARIARLPRKEQYRIGRADLLATSFETFERNIRDQLARMLSPGGFDPVRDIIGIAVNRWPHGFSYTYSSLYDPLEWVFTESAERPCVIARQPHGLISIANADAAASPHTDAAFLEAHRAVTEVLDRRAFPFARRDATNA